MIATSTADAELLSLCSATSDAVETSSLSKLSVGSIVVDRMSMRRREYVYTDDASTTTLMTAGTKVTPMVRVEIALR